MGLEQRLTRLEQTVPLPPRGAWCRACDGLHVENADDMLGLAALCRTGARPRLCGCGCCAALRPIARRYLRIRATERVHDGLVDLEPRLRCLAEGCGVDPDVAIAEAQRVLAEMSDGA